MRFSQKQIVIAVSSAALILGIVVLIFANLRSAPAGQQKFSLKVWGVESRTIFDNVIKTYKTIRPGADVKYTQFDQENYDGAILNALASGEGPDIFYLGNHDLPKWLNKLYPVSTQQFNLTQFRQLFPTAVEQDFVSASGNPAAGATSEIYALPLYLDTMALIYNGDMFDQAGIAAPPKTWDEFQKLIPGLRLIDPRGQITRAAAAIGGSEKTVDAGTDLLELLMMQNGAKMTSEDLRSATFAGQRGSLNPGISAFNFYLQFANPGSPYYTWNDGQPNSLDSFANGKTAMVFNYQSAAAEIKKKSPFLNFTVSSMPQPTGAQIFINFPKYAGLAVSKQSKIPGWAWDFILNLTTTTSLEKIYLDATGRQPALRQLIGARLDDPTLGVFARQALTARSWYEADSMATRAIMNDAIKAVLSGQKDSLKALYQAQDQVSGVMANRQ